MSRKKRDNFLNQLIIYVCIFLGIVVVGFFQKYNKEIITYRFVVLAVVLVLAAFATTLLVIIKRRKRINVDNYNFDENHISSMLKGMQPDEFERDIARMFTRLEYKAEHVGHTHDGGIDIEAEKNGEKYLIQCKHYTANENVGVEAVRAFSGVVSNHLAKKGFFITTSKFTPEAIEEFRDNPRIELINGSELVKYYMLSCKKKLKINTLKIV